MLWIVLNYFIKKLKCYYIFFNMNVVSNLKYKLNDSIRICMYI